SALPIAWQGGKLVVAVSDPPTRSLKRALERVVGSPVELQLCRADELIDALQYWYRAAPARTPFAAEPSRPTSPGDGGAQSDDSEMTDRIVEWLFEKAIEHGTSSVRVEVDDAGCRIRFGTSAESGGEVLLPSTSGEILVRRLRRASSLANEPGLTTGQV